MYSNKKKSKKKLGIYFKLIQRKPRRKVNIDKVVKLYWYKQRTSVAFRPQSREGATLVLFNNFLYLYGGNSGQYSS